MKFGDKLFALARAGQAFLHRHQNKTIVIVPFGPYAGTWHYNKANKRVMWEPRWAVYYCGTTALGPHGKSKRFALPQEIYALHGTKHPGRLHAESKKSLGSATSRWNAFHFKYIASFKDISDSFHALSFSSKEYSGFVIACSYAMPQALALLADNMADASLKFKFLSDNILMLSGLAPARRQRFVKSVLDVGIEKAMCKTYRATDKKIIKEFLSDKIYSWLPKTALDYMYLQSNDGSVDKEDYKKISQCCAFFQRRGKIRSLSIKIWKD